MRKRGLLILGIVGFLGVASLLLLNRYKTDMIQVTILNAVVQKAPPDYPEEQIRKRFEEVLKQAHDTGTVEAHLKRLLALAQRLEKIQHLEAAEVDLLLENLDRDPLPSSSEGSSEHRYRPANV